MHGDTKQLVKNPIRNFCKSLVRRIHPRYPSTPQDQDDAATAAPVETCQPIQDAINRVIQQGTFDWGSFSAFEDGSIELERAGVRLRFRNFSELKRNLNHAGEDEESASIGTWAAGVLASLRAMDVEAPTQRRRPSRSRFAHPIRDALAIPSFFGRSHDWLRFAKSVRGVGVSATPSLVA